MVLERHHLIAFSLSLGLGLSGQPAVFAGPNLASALPKQEVKTKAPFRLKGGVTEEVTPFLEGEPPRQLAVGTAVKVIAKVILNSETSSVGDQVQAYVSLDIKDGERVLLPGQWKVVGKVSQVESQKRAGRDGYIQIKFNKLISPDGKYEVPFEATVSTKDSPVKSFAKQFVRSTKYLGTGAVGGAMLSVELGGLPLAVGTQGYSVAAGAAAGAVVGAVGAVKGKGKILSIGPGDEIQFKIEQPVVLPAFNPIALPSATKAPVLADFDLKVGDYKFCTGPFGDKRTRRLAVEFIASNKTGKEYNFHQLAVMSDRGQVYYADALSRDMKERFRKIAPDSEEAGCITFLVDSPKHKYYLVLLESGTGKELTRSAIN